MKNKELARWFDIVLNKKLDKINEFHMDVEENLTIILQGQIKIQILLEKSKIEVKYNKNKINNNIKWLGHEDFI